MKFQFHCDKCEKPLGEYLYGKGGVEEKALITPAMHLPDIVCFECLRLSQEHNKIIKIDKNKL